MIGTVDDKPRHMSVETITLSRRQFVKQALFSIGSMAFLPFNHLAPAAQFPQADRLGRMTVGMAEVRNRPDADSTIVGKVYQDAVVPWIREVIGRRPLRINQRWVETPDGFIWTPYLQPVLNITNTLITKLPETSLGVGMWAEVTKPYVDLVLDNPPVRAPWLVENQSPRLYYSQVLWIDNIKQDEQGQAWYRVNERFGYGDIFWARAEAFRPVSQDEITPIHPEVENKRIVVNTTYQTLSCLEDQQEVYFARVSTGIKFDMYGNRMEQWETPLGVLPIWRKLISVHMSGGTTGGGYDLPGVSWTSLFNGNGIAIHSTYWHNNFGEESSHGCVNAAPEDAKWIFRWTNPFVSYDPGDLTVDMPGGTMVEVVE